MMEYFDITGSESSTYANPGSTASNEQESNPFRRARLNRDLPVPATADDAAPGILRQASTVNATPRGESAARPEIEDFYAELDRILAGGRVRPSAEVDPDDYG